MTSTVELPVWLFLLILAFAAVTAASHLLFPSVRWFLRRRMERVVAKLNTRLARPIEPFRLARRHDMIQRLVYDPQVVAAASEHAREQGAPDAVGFEQAERYAREIVPSFSATIYFGVALRIARMFSRAFYTVQVHVPETVSLRDISEKDTVVFVVNHRSNMDYMLITYLAADASALSYAVGEWARVWPLSWLIRGTGAYFIRRKSRDALYRKVLSRYVRLATDGGVTQAMFPEGGLSLDGAPQEPRMGLLKYIIEDFDADTRDVVFVPVALNYDRVLEDRILMNAAKAQKRKFDARISVITGFFLRQFGLRLRGRYKGFGTASVAVGAPLSLGTFQRRETTFAAEPLAEELMRRIAAAVPVVPAPLVCYVLLQADKPLTRAEIFTRAQMDIEGLPDANVHMPKGGLDEGLDTVLRLLSERNAILPEGDRWRVNPKKSDVLEYYANSIRHLM